MDKENKKSESALREEAVLQFWKENKIFEKSLEKDAPKGEYVFYEGPPTANGKPGIHHLEARAFKDVIPRYKTMQGFHVRRKGGWDTHGLPVELEVEKKLGLKSKKEIEEYGIAKFNQECKKSVWTYVDLWEKFTERIGFWLDQKNPYVTYHNDYIESVWNVIKETDNQKLLYKDYKVVPWCPRCETALSSHELAQGYEDVKDLSVYVKFQIVDENAVPAGSLKTSTDAYANGLAGVGDPGNRGPEQEHAGEVFILAWTTTPWTLLGNIALAVGEKIDYVKIKQGEEFLILAKARLGIIKGEYEVVEEFKGKDLVGLEYEPLYPYLKENISGSEKEKMDKAFKVYPADFVTTEDGTGVVHTAVMYGVDDFNLGTDIGLPKFHVVDLDGKFLDFTESWAGKFVRNENTAVEIIKDLAQRGLLFEKEKYEHSYPHCWRCHTALIYYARDSWYIRMSALREKLVKENEGINWEPDYIKEGRFGEWLREVKDWAISRERYWGSPLPVWTCEKCQKNEVIGSVADLKSKTKKSGNKYFVMRHGGTICNLADKICSKIEDADGLTEEGREQVLSSTRSLKNKKIDLIFSSDFSRTKETAEIARKELNIDGSNLILDKRIREINAGIYDGKKWSEYPHFFEKEKGAESLLDVKKRVSDFIYEVESKYKNKNILIITHEAAARLLFATDCLNFNFNNIDDYRKKFPVIKNAEIRELDFVPVPHNENYELDLHKPYIGETELVCDCGGKLERAKEVMDVWLDSGTMPFSQDHYPFENKELIDKNGGYPADFISEAIDQTRGWFYTLHAVGVLMGKGKAYKNVICLGLLLDAKGKKMSKSVGNVVDPWEMMDKYGVDTLRLWMYSVNQPGESKSFDEKVVLELHRQVFGLLYNVLTFYELYRDKDLERSFLEEERSDGKGKSLPNHILDQWILARLDELIVLCTEKMDSYKLLEPTRAIKDFIADLSTWYLRRSRERIKNDDHEAKQTLYFVLKTLARIMAPFAPLSSEDIWQKLKNDTDVESVHLTEWPVPKRTVLEEERSDGKRSVLKDDKIILEMRDVRKIVTLGLQARQKVGIPVRQPLGRLEVVCDRLDDKYLDIIKDELNVKEIKFDEGDELNISIDTNITEELRAEGQYRELVRAIQDMRKKIGLTPSDVITLFVETNEVGNKIVEKFENEIKKTVLASKLKYDVNDGEDIKIGDLVFKVQVVKK
jgi:isoleucyl-tRNA synthetase